MYDIKNLHYGFLRRANKVDSLQDVNFYVPQIDDYLNEALSIFIKETAKEVEYNQNRIDDLKNLMEFNKPLAIDCKKDFCTAKLPENYYRLVRIETIASKDGCIDKIKTYPIQFDDINNFLESSEYKPSFYWRETGYEIVENDILIWTNNDFKIKDVKLTYLSKHPRLGNPEDSFEGKYTLPDGTDVKQQSLLLDNADQPNIIMDLAVLLASTDINDINFQIKQNKILNINRI